MPKSLTEYMTDRYAWKCLLSFFIDHREIHTVNNCKQSIVFTNIWVAYCSPFCVAFLLFSLIVFCFQLISGINLKNTTDTLFFFKDETYRYIFQCLDKTKLSEAVASRLQRCQRWINGCLAASLPDLQMRILYWRPLLSLSLDHSFTFQSRLTNTAAGI